jgi:hypothetical protein
MTRAKTQSTPSEQLRSGLNLLFGLKIAFITPDLFSLPRLRKNAICKVLKKISEASEKSILRLRSGQVRRRRTEAVR